MTTWIEIGDTRYEVVPLDALTLLQMVQASKETGLTPEQMEKALLDKEAAGGVDQMAVTAVMIWAARVAAGESHPTVTSAQVPLREIRWISDDEGEVAEVDPTQPTPTPPASDSGEDASSEAPSDG